MALPPLRSGELDIERRHYDFLKARSGPEQWAIKYLYDRLNIIDPKTGALMRSNGMIIGFLGAIVTGVLRESGAIRDVLVPLLLVIVWIFLLLAGAELMSFSIFSLRFDRIRDDGDFDRYLKTFFTITVGRERKLQQALMLSALGTICFILLFASLAVYEILRTRQ